MSRRCALFICFLVTALALFAPIAAAADSCPDCGLGEDGCPPGSCPCCTEGAAIPTSVLQVDPGKDCTELLASPPAAPCCSADPAEIFHVPKRLLS